jgi:Flp pilus assembly protein TadD
MRRVLELDPGNAQALNFLGYLLAERGRELPHAEALIRKALDFEPDSGAFLDSLGWALLRQGKVDEAEKALTRAADLLAGDGTVREHLGDLYAAKGDETRALAEWRVAQGLDPEDPERLRRKILGAGKAAARR